MRKKIKLSLLEDNPLNTRLTVDHEKVSFLASSLEKHGLLSPIKVRQYGEKYQIVFGHRRVRAARSLGWTSILADIESFQDSQMIELSLIENVQRADLSDYEKALAFAKIHNDFEINLKEIGRIVGLSESHVSNYIRMTQLFDEKSIIKYPHILNDLSSISERHSRLLLMIEDIDNRASALRLVVSQDLSVRDLERIIHRLRGWFSKEDLQGADVLPSIGITLENEKMKPSANAFRVAILSFGSESNPFSQEILNDKSAFFLEDNELLLSQTGKTTVIGGFIDGLTSHGIEPLPVFKVSWIGGGIVSKKSYQNFSKQIMSKIKSLLPLDGILVDLNGAMMAEKTLDPEGVLLEQIRSVVGKGVRIVSVIDLHGNLTERKYRSSDVIFGLRSNPHIDYFERGKKAADTIYAILTKKIAPVMTIRRVPIFPYDLGMSTWSFHKEMERRLPFGKILAKSKQLEAQFEGLVDISIFIGLHQPNLPESVISVLATGESDGVVRKSTDLIAHEIWESRFEFFSARQLVSVDRAIERAEQSKLGPVILVDVGDNTGGGSSGDSNFILEALLRKGVHDAVVPLRDPHAVREAFAKGVGTIADFELGGKIDGRFSKPIKIRGKVKLLSDGNYQIRGPCDSGNGRVGSRFDPWLEGNSGRLAVLKTDTLEIIITEGKAGKERDFYKSAGIDPSERKIVVVKSLEAHRASFESLASEIIEVDSPGITSLKFAKSVFESSSVQMFPFNPSEFELSPFTVTSK